MLFKFYYSANPDTVPNDHEFQNDEANTFKEVWMRKIKHYQILQNFCREAKENIPMDALLAQLTIGEVDFVPPHAGCNVRRNVSSG